MELRPKREPFLSVDNLIGPAIEITHFEKEGPKWFMPRNP